MSFTELFSVVIALLFASTFPAVCSTIEDNTCDAEAAAS
jgi:hypothetical protein